MPLDYLETFQFRNLEKVGIEFSPGTQLIYGDNASGKTSFLEAAHILCCAKSFLGASPRKLQKFNTHDFSLNGIISQKEDLQYSTQYRWQDNQLTLLRDNHPIQRISEYVVFQPTQAITPISYRLLDDSPDIRRRFMDWGVFHVKPEYGQLWIRFRKNLLHRNAILNGKGDKKILSAWNREYIQLAKRLSDLRKEYIGLLSGIVEGYFQKLLPEHNLVIHYRRGWDEEYDLSELLDSYFYKDKERGYTYYGPQRDDLILQLNGVLARDSASRGQKKLITFALYLAQASLQQQQGRYSSLLIVDDLPGELDLEHVLRVMDICIDLPMQVLISCIDIKQLPKKHQTADKMFHVKQGRIKEVLQ